MKISDLIAELQALMEDYGDLPVESIEYAWDYGFGSEPHYDLVGPYNVRYVEGRIRIDAR